MSEVALKHAKIAVIGLGYVGCHSPLSLERSAVSLDTMSIDIELRSFAMAWTGRASAHVMN